MSILDRVIELQTTARVFRVGRVTVVNRSGKAIQIPDEDGFIHMVLSGLDGSAPLSDVYEKLPETLRKIHPAEHVLDIATQLDSFCIFENKGMTGKNRKALTDYEYGRWNRNLDFFAAYCLMDGNKFAVQKAISRAHVVLLGVGGIGTHTLLDLVSLGFTHITAVDFDTVELSTLNRQILYGEKDIGRKKIDAAQDAINRYITQERHDIQFLDAYIDGPDTAQTIVTGADVIISCVDRPTEVARWINEACVRENIPLVAGGLDTTRTTIYTVLPGRSGCVECWRRDCAAVSEENSSLLELELERDVLTLPSRPAVVNLVSVHAGFLISEAIKIVTGICPPSAVDRLVEFDFQTMKTKVAEEWHMRSDCPVCGASTPEAVEA